VSGRRHRSRARAVVAVLTAAALLAGCAGGPPPPDWELLASGALRSFEAATLRGDTRIATLEFERARAEIARTGRPDLVARAELARCALRVASLQFDDCPGFQPLAQDADPQTRAYAAYIGGRWDAVEASLLPSQHRVVVAHHGSSGVLVSIDDPVSRMVAAGALLRTARIVPVDIAMAIETASEQGWRRPLLAWLGVQQRRARAAGDTEAAAQIGRRIDLVLESGVTR
jgi:hypothetical protein